MRKKEILLPVLAVAAGIVGLGLRRWELLTAFEPDTGLAIPGMPATLALVVCSLLAVLLLGLLSRGKHSDLDSYDQAFAAKGNTVYLTLMVSAALLMLLSALLGGLALLPAYEAAALQEAMQGGPSPAFSVLPRALLCGFSAASGVCLLKLGQTSHRGESGGRFNSALLVPAYSACIWLIVAYQSRSGDPVVLDYVWELFAIIAAVLGTYLMAGFAFERAKVRRTTWAMLCAIYFLLLTLADGHSLPTLLLCGGFLLYLLSSVSVLLWNAGRPVPTPAAERLDPEDLIREDTPNGQ